MSDGSIRHFRCHLVEVGVELSHGLGLDVVLDDAVDLGTGVVGLTVGLDGGKNVVHCCFPGLNILG